MRVPFGEESRVGRDDIRKRNASDRDGRQAEIESQLFLSKVPDG